MSVLENTITTTEMTDPRDVLAVLNFTHEYDRFAETIGLLPVEVIAAGTQLKMIKLTGDLGEGDVAEGDEVTLTKYTATEEPIGTVKTHRFAKLTTAEAIQKSGKDIAVDRTDKRMAGQLRAKVMSDFYDLLTKQGTGTADAGETLQATLANMDAKLHDVTEKNDDSADNVIYFANMYDVATYLGKDNQVTNQTLFGLKYLQGFLGTEHMIITNRIEKGTVICTPVENLHAYGIDFDALSDSGLDYEDLDTGIIGFHHAADYDRDSVKTYAKIAVNFVPEIKDYIVKGTITPLE